MMRNRNLRDYVGLSIVTLLSVLLSPFTGLSANLEPSWTRPVGALRIELSSQDVVAISVPFESQGERLSDLVSVDSDVRLLTWDNSEQRYNLDASSEQVAPVPGDGLWMANEGQESLTACLYGYLPDRIDELEIAPSLNLKGLPYPTALESRPEWPKDLVQTSTTEDKLVKEKVAWPLLHAEWLDNRSDKKVSWMPGAVSAAWTAGSDENAMLNISATTAGIQLALQADWKQVVLLRKDIPADAELDVSSGWTVMANLKEVAWPTSTPGSLFMACNADADTDQDGLCNGLEHFSTGTDPLNADSDADGLPDGWERENSLNPLINDALLDADGDGICNAAEYERGTDPLDSKSKNVTFYVDGEKGSDARKGHAASVVNDKGPLKTINSALRKTLAGDTVSVAGGSYHEAVDISCLDIKFVITGHVKLK